MKKAGPIVTYGDPRGGHITASRHPLGGWIAVYRTQFHGACFPIGWGRTEQGAIRNLWKLQSKHG